MIIKRLQSELMSFLYIGIVISSTYQHIVQLCLPHSLFSQSTASRSFDQCTDQWAKEMTTFWQCIQLSRPTAMELLRQFQNLPLRYSSKFKWFSIRDIIYLQYLHIINIENILTAAIQAFFVIIELVGLLTHSEVTFKNFVKSFFMSWNFVFRVL